MVITTAQLQSLKPELRFCAGSNPARGMSEIRNGEDIWQWSQLEIRLNVFRRSTIPQKQFIIIFIIVGTFTSNFYKKKVDQKNQLPCIVSFNFLTFYYLRDTIPFTNTGQILLDVLICFLYF